MNLSLQTEWRPTDPTFLSFPSIYPTRMIQTICTSTSRSNNEIVIMTNHPKTKSDSPSLKSWGKTTSAGLWWWWWGDDDADIVIKSMSADDVCRYNPLFIYLYLCHGGCWYWYLLLQDQMDIFRVRVVNISESGENSIQNISHTLQRFIVCGKFFSNNSKRRSFGTDYPVGILRHMYKNLSLTIN